MGKKTFEVTTENFGSEVVDSDMPVLVDFWATWCGPCKMIAPIVENLAEKYEGRMRVGKLDADEHQDIVMNYGVMGIPTLILFKKGEPVVRITGYQPEERIVKQIEPALV
jgi:thioredoxin 1